MKRFVLINLPRHDCCLLKEKDTKVGKNIKDGVSKGFIAPSVKNFLRMDPRTLEKFFWEKLRVERDELGFGRGGVVR